MRNNEITIESVEHAEEKSRIVEEVLLDLPEWFGLPDKTKEYIEQSKVLTLFVAKNRHTIIGFITLKPTSKYVCEVHCMGIKKEYHRKGIGTVLHQTLEEFANEKFEFMQVKTVEEGHYKEYNQTVAFYRSIGFKEMEVFPTLWDEWNPCLIMIKKI